MGSVVWVIESVFFPRSLSNRPTSSPFRSKLGRQYCIGLRSLLLFQRTFRWPFYVPCQSEECQNAEEVSMQVNLPPRQTMKCGTRKGVVVVVPAVTEYGDRQEEIVAAVIVAAVRPGSKQMTERIHAPDRVMPQCNPNQTAPQESVECTVPAANEPISEPGRNSQPQ